MLKVTIQINKVRVNLILVLQVLADAIQAWINKTNIFLKDSFSSGQSNSFKRGKVRPEGVIDLHGYRLYNAKIALQRYIVNAYENNIINKDNGLLVELGDHQSISLKLGYLIKSGKLKYIKKNARDYIVEKHSIEKILEKEMYLLKQI